MPEHDDDPLIKYSAALAAVVIAVVLSVMIAATAAGQIDADYRTRAVAYTGLVAWVLIGAVVIFMLAHKGEAPRLSAARIVLWTVSIWLWPVLLLMHVRRSGRDGDA